MIAAVQARMPLVGTVAACVYVCVFMYVLCMVLACLCRIQYNG